MKDINIISQKINSIAILGAMVCMVYSLLAGAYWNDAARWADRIKTISDKYERTQIPNQAQGTTKQTLDEYKSELSRARKYRDRAEQVFKVATAMVVLAIFLTALPIYTESERVMQICKWVLTIPMTFMFLVALYYVFTKQYLVPLE